MILEGKPPDILKNTHKRKINCNNIKSMMKIITSIFISNDLITSAGKLKKLNVPQPLTVK